MKKIRPHRLDTPGTKKQVLKLNDDIDEYRKEWKNDT